MPTDDQRRRFDERRALIFWMGSAAAILSVAAQAATAQNRLQLSWELSSAVVCGLAGWFIRHPSERVRALSAATLSVFLLVSTPIVVVQVGRPTELAVLIALPLALTIVFLDRVVVVGVVCGAGVCVNTIAATYLRWSLSDVLHLFAAMMALYGAGLLGAFEFARMRKQEREHQESLRRAVAVQLQSERLVVLGTLAAAVGHEINNPLAYVSANLKFLLETEPEGASPERQEVWKETTGGLSRIAAIVGDLKGLARSSSRVVEAVHVEPLLRQTARLTTLRGQGTLRVEVSVEEGLPACLCDEQRLAQVMLNLAVNACDALAESRPAAPLIRFVAARAGDRLLIDVEDNGAGVSPAVKAQLFTPFFTTKAAGVGTGLGLVVSREYLETFGGRITCEDSTLGGARFQLSLPLAPTRTEGGLPD